MVEEQEYNITCIAKNIYVLHTTEIDLETSYILLNKETYELPIQPDYITQKNITYETSSTEINYSFKFDDTYDFFNIKINLYRCEMIKYREYYQEIIKELNSFFII